MKYSYHPNRNPVINEADVPVAGTVLCLREAAYYSSLRLDRKLSPVRCLSVNGIAEMGSMRCISKAAGQWAISSSGTWVTVTNNNYIHQHNKLQTQTKTTATTTTLWSPFRHPIA